MDIGFAQDTAEWLRSIYNSRHEKNRAYSLRAFARQLEIPPGRLSEIFRSKRRITKKIADKIADRLDLNPNEKNDLMDIVEGRRARSVSDSKYEKLSEDSFHVIADWYHYAILSLMELDDFKSSELWIAKRLGITTSEVTSALTRLKRLEIIADQKGKLVLTKKNLTTTHDVPSSALRRSHKQSLEQAIDALEKISVEYRSITSSTMAIDPKKIPEAKKAIKDFRRKIAAYLENGKRKEVYNLNIQLVPVTKLEKKK